VTADSDAIITINESHIPIEIMCDYTCYWTNSGRIDLRDNKYHKLKDSNSLFVGFSTADNKILVIDFSKNLDYKYIEYHTAYGGKPVYSVQIPQESIYPFEIPIMVGVINNMCKGDYKYEV
jgi:hypothetical protein